MHRTVDMIPVISANFVIFYNLNTYKRSESETLNKYSTIIIDSVGTCFGFVLLNVHKYGHTTYFPPSKYYCAVSDVKFRGQLILFVCLQWSVGLPVNQTEEISVYVTTLEGSYSSKL